jgi:FMN phosphatase YigB (HAD superfamily)
MLVRKEKTILTDCDGVLLDWEYGFDQWMDRHNYKILNQSNEYNVNVKYGISIEKAMRLVKMFNESAQIRKLSPLRDAIKYVRKLHIDYGYVFHIISSLSDDEYSRHLRTKNLRELFGDTVFERYMYLDCGASKKQALSKYKNSNCWWIEDNIQNAIDGKNLGLNSLIMSHNYNFKQPKNIQRVQNWKEIYQKIIDH